MKPTVYVLLLRGINVGGNQIIRMADLKEVLSRTGLMEDVETYIQSGNVLFATTQSDRKLLSDQSSMCYHLYASSQRLLESHHVSMLRRLTLALSQMMRPEVASGEPARIDRPPRARRHRIIIHRRLRW